MQKKLLLFVNILLMSFLLVSCGAKYTVTFDSNGGTAVQAQEVKKGQTAIEPKEPTRPNHSFVEWRLNGSKYDFATEVKGDITLKAEWKKNEPVILTFTANETRVEKGHNIKLNVNVTGAEDTSVSFLVSHPELVKVENNELVVIGDVTIDTLVTVQAIANANKQVTQSRSFTVVAPFIEGQVGELTSDMLKALGNQNITVTGTIVDTYQNFLMPIYDYENTYNTKVEMSEGAWYGEWSAQENPEVITTDNYRMGTDDNVKDSYGNVGHSIDKIFIGKDNTVVRKPEKDYLSVKAVWEAQHLWNHISNLSVNKFSYDPENDIYKYNFNPESESDLYLMTYLSYSLTPLLTETLNELYLKVENGQIVSLSGQTEVVYFGAENREDAEAMEYSTVELTFSKIGETKVTDPKPFEQPQHADKLQAALAKMHDARNYSFHIKEVLTHQPSGNGDDYEITTSSPALAASPRKNGFKGNSVSKTGIVGCLGQVTEDAIVLGKTNKYAYTMEDDKIYHTEYYAYKQNDNNTYDYLEHYGGKFIGRNQYKGDIHGILPTFEFNSAIFDYLFTEFKNGVEVYTFKLKESAVTRDVALELALKDYSKNASATGIKSFEIKVDQNGNLIQAVFPFDVNRGVYLGYYEIDFLQVGTSVLFDDTFENYVPRTVPTTWADFLIKDYYEIPGQGSQIEMNAQSVFEAIFPEGYNNLPAPTLFQEVFGDNLYGPFYNDRMVGKDASDNDIYIRYITITTSSRNYDENARILDYDELITLYGNLLEAEGYTFSAANSNTPQEVTTQGDRYITYIKDNMQIVLWNNGTKNFRIYFYKLGDWNLQR